MNGNATWKILVVDDEEDVHPVTTLMRRGMARMDEATHAVSSPRHCLLRTGHGRATARLAGVPPDRGVLCRRPGLGIPRGTILAATGSREPLKGHPLAEAGRLRYESIAGTAPVDIRGRERVIRLQSHFDETHYIHAEITRDIDNIRHARGYRESHLP